VQERGKWKDAPAHTHPCLSLSLPWHRPAAKKFFNDTVKMDRYYNAQLAAGAARRQNKGIFLSRRLNSLGVKVGGGILICV